MIKKIVALLSVLVLGVSLVACSTGTNAKEEVKTFVNNSRKGISSELTYYYVGDNVTKQTLKNKLVLSELPGDKDDIKKQISKLSEQYTGIDGIKYDLKIGDTEIIETATIDFFNLDIDKAKKIAGAILGSDPKKISMKKTEEAIKAQGYKLK